MTRVKYRRKPTSINLFLILYKSNTNQTKSFGRPVSNRRKFELKFQAMVRKKHQRFDRMKIQNSTISKLATDFAKSCPPQFKEIGSLNTKWRKLREKAHSFLPRIRSNGLPNLLDIPSLN